MRLKSGDSGAKWPTNSGLVAMFVGDAAEWAMAICSRRRPTPRATPHPAQSPCARRSARPASAPSDGSATDPLVAKCRRDELAEVVVGLAVRGQIAPQIAAGRLVHVGNLLQQRIAVGHNALVVVGALLRRGSPVARSFPDSRCRWPPSTRRGRRRRLRRSRRSCRARRTAAPVCARWA